MKMQLFILVKSKTSETADKAQTDLANQTYIIYTPRAFFASCFFTFLHDFLENYFCLLNFEIEHAKKAHRV